jgi:ankyrin repeat protein
MNRINGELIVAIGENDVPEVHRLLSVGADIEVKDHEGTITPLQSASFSGHVEVVKELMDNGADIEAENCNGWTSLHMASMMGH